jgi:hypothetical protein
MFNIDGNQSLANQEAAIRDYEAAACELLGILPLMDGSNNNGASFQNLAAGVEPNQISLTLGAIPPGGTLVCVATIYVVGILTKVFAYR